MTLPSGGVDVGADPPWDARTPREVADRLAGVKPPWYIASGWALDLFVGEQTRDHDDVEIGVPIGRFGEIRAALPGYEWDVVGDGKAWPLDSPAYDVMHQTWARDPATGIYKLDVFREPHDGDVWICRRSDEIRFPYADIIDRTADGIPFLRPEIVLLFKAKHAREKDDADFERVLPRLDRSQRSWLRDALGLVYPGHRWLSDGLP